LSLSAAVICGQRVYLYTPPAVFGLSGP